MQQFQADIASEDGNILIRNLTVWLAEITHPNGFNREWHGAFTLKGEDQRLINILGRYHLFLNNGRTCEFLLTRLQPTVDLTSEVEFRVSGDVK